MDKSITAPVRCDVLDIDNGPEWTVFDKNSHLYSIKGLKLIKGLLTSNGVSLFWSTSHTSAFVDRLNSVFGNVHQYIVQHESGIPDHVYIATHK
ncbi:hypothetical protein AAC03nite_09930 [Alicyclobacillus acidoterrestris]|nr:hypothetical protein AAC03nite_09930 [Alicyclobacillus acidoterrestris]